MAEGGLNPGSASANVHGALRISACQAGGNYVLLFQNDKRVPAEGWGESGGQGLREV